MPMTIDAVCSPKDTLDFLQDKRATIGHLHSFSFPIGGVDLKPDMEVTDPENPGSAKVPVVGIFDLMRWSGTESDPLHTLFRLTDVNFPDYAQAKDDRKMGCDVKLEFTIYRYDFNEKKYYKHFHTDGKPVICVVTKGESDDYSHDPDTRIQYPTNFLIPLVLTGKTEGEPQKLIVAKRATAPQSYDFGVKQAK